MLSGTDITLGIAELRGGMSNTTLYLQFPPLRITMTLQQILSHMLEKRQKIDCTDIRIDPKA